MNRPLDKGGAAEELMRAYFLGLGYFVVRGARLRFQDNDVTDVDLWLYTRTSPISRERACVDVKYKASPKALERVLWVKGLQAILRVDKAYVATSERRPTVRNFAAPYGVNVIDGPIFDSLEKTPPAVPERIPQEEFRDLLERSSVGKLGGDWPGKFEAAKDRLVSKLNADGMNELLHASKFFLEKVIASRDEIACRVSYAVAAYFLVVLDFVCSSYSLLEPEARYKSVVEALRFGKDGAAKAEEIIRTTTHVVQAYAPQAAGGLRQELSQQFTAIPAEIIADYFLKESVAKELFNVARALESHGFERQFIAPQNLDPQLRAALAALLDFHKIDRVKFFEAVQRPASAKASTTEEAKA